MILKSTIFVLFILLLTCAMIGTVFSHEGEDPEAVWYRSLKTPEGAVSCCSPSRDCETVSSYKAGPEPGSYLALYHGEWVNVPANVVLKRSDNPTGQAVLCIMHLDGVPVARCFITPSEG